MLFAERHGKLGRNGSRAHDRAEDLLTSTAFQLLRYLPLEVGLLAVLRRMRAVGSDGHVATEAPAWLMLNTVTAADYTFWPRWAGFGEPDVVVTLSASGVTVGRLVIEVKLDAGKSGEAKEDTETADAPDPDQLRRYWQGLRTTSDAPALGVVYLTSHPIPPVDDLTVSVAREPGDWLGWLSWRTVWSVVRASELLPARDLADILAAKGLKCFDGFHSQPWILPHSPRRYWSAPSAIWFAQPVRVFPNSARFWTSLRGIS
ncbi:hypothetical protein J8F10_25615 [Gemmata sp. G18]|uniref:PD-(D/E)XK nuclease superfamily protein n=1 Tax=Gemmata palustris TaxID=2822762 RepID=A0ABS5BY70_9BACT|nr:hypothetical protein [Gemmata palustris]MBP3958639.1 hypothetical protein [Gemmata palustris]